jgi:hypothetical protein
VIWVRELFSLGNVLYFLGQLRMFSLGKSVIRFLDKELLFFELKDKFGLSKNKFFEKERFFLC